MSDHPHRRATLAAGLALAIIPLNYAVWTTGFPVSRSGPPAMTLTFFTLFAALQLVLGVYAVGAVVHAKRHGAPGGGGAALLGLLAALGAPIGWFLGWVGLNLNLAGGAWGRPLRIRGRQLHPNLRIGADWTLGPQPDPSALDAPTRRALEALWLHDAQKEHASVPAFSRVSWLLAAVGAPAELLEWAHRAALEEIAHTRLCFALAAGYAGRSHTVEPMPELLVGGLDERADPLVTLAVESLTDGGQLEDFNADVAARCAEVCEEPTTRAALEQIAREERSHAELSWAVLAYTLERDRARVLPHVERALARLDAYPRPTAARRELLGILAAADPDALRAHGRLPDSEWAAAWDARRILTTARARALFDGASARTAEGTRAA